MPLTPTALGSAGSAKISSIVWMDLSKVDIAALCKKIEQETSTTVTIDNRPVAIRASFGYALAKVDGGTVADLIKVADMRMYKNKRHCSAGFR